MLPPSSRRALVLLIGTAALFVVTITIALIWSSGNDDGPSDEAQRRVGQTTTSRRGDITPTTRGVSTTTTPTTTETGVASGLAGEGATRADMATADSGAESMIGIGLALVVAALVLGRLARAPSQGRG
ncbi:MAG: hypothetical protein ACRD0U_00550 [Acidimicrobiales bacterium]